MSYPSFACYGFLGNGKVSIHGIYYILAGFCLVSLFFEEMTRRTLHETVNKHKDGKEKHTSAQF